MYKDSLTTQGRKVYYLLSVILLDENADLLQCAKHQLLLIYFFYIQANFCLLRLHFYFSLHASTDQFTHSNVGFFITKLCSSLNILQSSNPKSVQLAQFNLMLNIFSYCGRSIFMKTKNEFKVFLYCRSELNETLPNSQELQLLQMMSSETV